MKRALALILALLLIGSAALAEIDLSGLSYDELLELREQVNLAIWNSESWHEIEVPAGVYIIGEDIPAGRYDLSYVGPYNALVALYKDKDKYMEHHIVLAILNESLNDDQHLTITLDDGEYLELSGAENIYIFKHFTGAALGFK